MVLGDVMTFTMVVSNTGPNAITRLVVTDTYSSACMALAGWNITPTQQSAGQAIWNTLIPNDPPAAARTDYYPYPLLYCDECVVGL